MEGNILKHNVLITNKTVATINGGTATVFGQNVIENGEFKWKSRINATKRGLNKNMPYIAIINVKHRQRKNNSTNGLTEFGYVLCGGRNSEI